MRVTFMLAAWAALVSALPAQSGNDTTAPTAPPAAVPAPTEAVRAFDPAKVEVAWNNRRWQLVHQGQVLKDFGSHEHDARLALRLVRELKLDGHGTVGSPRPLMEYWLAGGQAPRSAAGALRSVPLDAARLRVEQVQGQWCVRDGARVLFNFGPAAAEAREALAVIQKHRFDHVAFLGRTAPSMYVFLRQPIDESAMRPTNAAARASRQMEAARQPRVAKGPDGTPKPMQKQPAPGAGLDQVVTPAVPPLAAAPPYRDARRAVTFGPHQAQAPPQPVPTDRVLFDWRQAHIKQVNGEWAVHAGSVMLGKFGPNYQAAQQALSALRHYRFTEQRRVGDPAVVLYLPTGKSPRGMLLGLPAAQFTPEQLAVQQIEGRYALVQGKRVVLSMGPRKEEAEKVLGLVQAQGYDRLCQLGDPTKDGVSFFVRSR